MVRKLNDKKSTILQSRAQSDIILARRKVRRARITAIHTSVHQIINGNMKHEEADMNDSFQRAAREVAASKE